MLESILYVCFAILNFSTSRFLSIPPSRLIYQFPIGTFVENIACRPNGQLLLSILSEPVLYSIDPTAPQPVPKIVHTFPNVTGMSGLAETEIPDVFAIKAGIWNLTDFKGQMGSFSVWSVDFRSDPPLVAMIAPIPHTSNLNGLAHIKGSPNTLLLADSELGAVWALDTRSGKSRIAIQDPTLDPSEDFPLGVNGISTHKHHLYFTNSGQRSYGRIPIHPDGSAAGHSQKLGALNDSAFEAFDDFALDGEGNALVATHPNAVFKISPSGEQSLLSMSEHLVQPTSAMLGRGSAKEEATLYITTGGESGGSTLWDATEEGTAQGSQLFAIDDYPTSQFEQWLGRAQLVL